MGSQQKKKGGTVKRMKVAAATTDVTMDVDLLDCPVCCYPMRPPVFQCTVGHTICSSCHEKLPKKCHFCSRPRVSRCYMAERVIESIKVACSNVNHGCTVRTTNYQKEDHEKSCPHAPCFCPETGCSFSGSTVMLLDHFSSKHDWLCPQVKYGYRSLAFGLKVGTTVLVGEDGHLFLLNVKLKSLDGVISICGIHPHITGSKFKCVMTLTRHDPDYSQTTVIDVRSTNLHDGLPKDCIPVIVPELALLNTGASALAKLGMVLGVELRPQ
ncbi:hypothetical protein ACQ4PT_033960 [Festuca glaucescens]